MRYVIGVDIGGTFTDFVIIDERAGETLLKVPSTKNQPDSAVFDGLSQYTASRQLSVDQLLRETELFVHGTTIATNAVIERTGPVVGLLTTAGHRDILRLRDGFKPDRYNIRIDPPEPFVPRRLCQPVRERIMYNGSVRTPLDSADLHRAVERLLGFGAESIAVSLLWAIQNPIHELMVKERLAEWLPEMPVTLSHEVLPSIGEWPRTSATVLSAYAQPVVSTYLRRLEAELARRGYKGRLLIMQSNGGTATVAEIERRAVVLLASGPAAGPAAGLHVTRQVSRPNVITVDMGGTSFDVSMIRKGSAAMSTELQVDNQPVGVPALEIHSIGAGGGSIAWVDGGGALNVGPRSAGANPGPACYGKGGVEPTVTDANLVLGLLAEANPLGGKLTLDKRRAERAIEERIAAPLGIGLVEAALAIYAIVNHNMVQAIRALSVQRGIDPRNYALVVGGGAGPMHGARLAEILAMPRVLVPREAGVLCALGMVRTNVRHDYTRSQPQTSEEPDLTLINRLIASMEACALRDLTAEGFRTADITLERSVDMLYRNQVKELNVPLGPGKLTTAHIQTACQHFHEAHEARYTYSIPDAPMDFHHWRVTGYGHVDHGEEPPERPRPELDATPALKGKRDVHLGPDQTPTAVPIYDGERLRYGMEVRGPAVIERPTTTIALFATQHVTVAELGTVIITVNGTVRTPAPRKPHV